VAAAARPPPHVIVARVEELLGDLAEEAERDADCLGLVVIGSHSAGIADEESDLDVLYVLRGGKGDRERRGKLELIPVALDEFREAPEWFKPALGNARVVLDKTGELAAVVDEAGRVSRDEVAEAYDGYLNDVYRSLKAWRRGNELAGRIEGIESLKYLVQFLYGLEGRRAPYSNAWAGNLGELEPLVLEVARTADPRRQQLLLARVRELASEYRDVYDAWGGDIDRALEFEFE
jgi:predicted nucleotidyltransferase